MNKYCLCCSKCKKNKTIYGWLRLICTSVSSLVFTYSGRYEISIDFLLRECNECKKYTPRPEPQFSQCVAVLKMLGVEVGE